MTRHEGVPLTVAKAAVKERNRKRTDSYEKTDEVWAVFDRDEHPHYEEARDLCRRNKVGLAYSDPCFELWLILHEEDYDKADGHHTVQSYLKEIRPEYDPQKKKTPDCTDLVQRTSIAEERAEKQLNRREQERNSSGRPSTSVGHLTLAIRNAAKATT